MSEPARAARRNRIIGLILAAAILAVYGRVMWHPFIELDDDLYVAKNARVARGITPDGIAYAFTSMEIGHWHPLTFLSHMLDVQVFGLHAGGHHAVNLMLHIVNTLLLFSVLTRMTGCPWRSAFVAGLFAIHPLHVEPVASISCRKDLLSALFWLLTFAAYRRHVEKPSARRYGTVTLWVVMALMSKPISVTLPFVLLLLDLWPLGRVFGSEGSPSSAKRLGALTFEKTPLLLLSLASCAITYFAAQTSGVLPSMAQVPVSARLANAALAYFAYLRQMVWPADLAAFYPVQPGRVSLALASGAALALFLITILALSQARRRPYLTVGWLWYLLTLAPVSGIVPIGLHVRADRYTYIPLIGLFIVVAWGAADLLQKWRIRPARQGALAGALLAGLAVCAFVQTGHWADSQTVWSHALAVTSNNFMAHNNLGTALQGAGKLEEAAEQYVRAMQAYPAMEGRAPSRLPLFEKPYYNLGLIRHLQGKLAEAEDLFSKALRMNPKDADTHNNLGMVLAARGRADEAVACYAQALELKPDHLEARVNLGAVLAAMGRFDEAIACYKRVLTLDPAHSEAHNNLGNVYGRQGKYAEAAVQYEAALRLKPGNALAHYNLGCALELQGKAGEALRAFEQALRLKPDFEAARKALDRVRAAHAPVGTSVPRAQ